MRPEREARDILNLLVLSRMHCCGAHVGAGTCGKLTEYYYDNPKLGLRWFCCPDHWGIKFVYSTPERIR